MAARSLAVLAGLLLPLIMPGLAVRAAAPKAPAAIDWPAFLARHDLVWKRLPTRWEEGPFLGNGLIGAVMYAPEGALSWQLGRSDLTDHRAEPHPMRARARLPLGRMVLHLGAPATGMDARLDLWNAEVSGTLSAGRTQLPFRSFVHADEPVLVIELAAALDPADHPLLLPAGHPHQ